MIKDIFKNKIIIIALLILSFIGILSSSISVEAAGKSWIDPNGQGDDTPKVYISALKSGQDITFGAWSYNDNVFCVQHGQKLIRVSGGSEKYKLTDTYVITATDIKKNGTSINPSSDLLNYAQGVAYILSLDNTWTGTRDDALGTNEGMAQHVLWAYLNDSDLCTKLGMYKGKDYTPKGDEITAYNTALEIAKGNADKAYEATYHIFQNAESGDPTQRLIILEKTGETEVTDDLQISINKVDAKDSSNKLAGAKFKVTIKEDNPWLIDLIDPTIYDGEISTDENGYATTGVISGVDIEEKLNVTIEETQAPEGYESLGKKIKFSLEYNSSTGKWESSDFNSKISSFDGEVTGNVSSSKVSLTITNEVMDSISLNLLKGSSIGAATDGTTFSFDFTNVVDFRVKGKYISNESVLFGQDETCTVKNESGKWMCNGIEINALIVKDGGIFIDEINFEDSDKEVEITITELQAPADHALISTPVKIKVELKKRLILADKAEITEHTELSEEIRNIEVVENSEGKEFQVNVDLMNFVYIDVKGKVWLDGQTGLKSSSGFNGKKDSSEKWMKDIKVYLYGDETLTTTTDSNGEYLFERVKYKPGIYLVFEYDGINYIATKKIESAGDITSDVTEISREQFNKKFVMINPDAAYSADGNKTTDLDYDESKATKAIVDTTGDVFKMQASTDTISSYEPVVEFNCGLVKREFDMDLTTNLDFVEVKVNGKTTDYNYSIDENGNATLVNRDGGKTSKATYNQYLYESDYNYDITDYFDNTNAGYNLTEDEKNDLKEDEGKITDADELEVFVIYKINVNNQTNKNAYVYRITDYYSDCFDGIVECYYMDGANKKSISNDNISIESSDKASYTKSTINLNNKVTDLQSIYIKLKLNNSKLDPNNNLQVGNIAEISAYGSDEGYIDMNSKPGNMINSDGTIRYEDDTDEAGTLNIMWTEKERTLTGVVWDDSSKGNPDGEYTDGETLIDGVTVQLIEIREITAASGVTYQLEYIWQETTTADDKVLKTTLDGTEVKEYTYTGDISKKDLEGYIYVEDYDKNNEKFHYLFTGFIPGNYIIRYKYGTDGGSYDGNAYKSTYDTTGENRYKGDKELNVNDSKRYSDAYDNEARRLGEMAIFAGETITKDSTSNLAEHWMCADTNRFAAQIANKNNLVTDGVQNVNNIAQEYKENYNLSEVDFGVMKRPETEISLEKHLTALSIDVAGEGKILDATFDLAGYLNNPDAKLEDYLTGNVENLTQIYSTRNERGFWKVETDVNELMNGAELSAEYTYVVSNNTSDADYLTAQLVNAYEKLSSGFTCEFIFEENPGVSITLMPGEGEGLYTYQSLLKDLESRTKTMIRKGGHTNGYYIGEFYYTGEASAKEKPVTVKVNKIEELLNNEFVFDERINYSSYGDNKNYSSAYTSTSQETLVDYQHIEYDGEGKKIIASGTGETNSNYKVYDKNGSPKDVHIIIKKEDGKEIATITADGKDGYTIVQSRAGNKYLEPISATSDLTERVDIARKVVLTKTLNTNNINEMLFDSYNAEILSYSVASGRRSTSSTPGNLTYSYSADTDMTLDNCYYVESANQTYKQKEGETDKYICLETGAEVTEANLSSLGARKLNETDEFWGETIIITAPTGNNTVLWIVLVVTCALIILGGIFGIKKIVLKH